MSKYRFLSIIVYQVQLISLIDNTLGSNEITVSKSTFVLIPAFSSVVLM